MARFAGIRELPAGMTGGETRRPLGSTRAQTTHRNAATKRLSRTDVIGLVTAPIRAC